MITDTDSLMYEIKMEDMYEDFSKDKENLIIVIIQLSLMIQANYLLVKLKLKRLLLKCLLY